MDYIIQIEKLYKYFELSLSAEENNKLVLIKKLFKNDLNLMGCYLKDFIILQKENYEINDNELYNESVLLFEKEDKQELINSFEKYAKYYLAIVFEYENNQDFINAACIINSCFALDCYPVLIKLYDQLNTGIINSNTFKTKTENLVDFILDRFEHFETYKEQKNLFNIFLNIEENERLIS